jgi:hypothetical protein
MSHLHAPMVPPGDQGDALDYTDCTADKPTPVTLIGDIRFNKCDLDRCLTVEPGAYVPRGDIRQNQHQ